MEEALNSTCGFMMPVVGMGWASDSEARCCKISNSNFSNMAGMGDLHFRVGADMHHISPLLLIWARMEGRWDSWAERHRSYPRTMGKGKGNKAKEW